MDETEFSIDCSCIESNFDLFLYFNEFNNRRRLMKSLDEKNEKEKKPKNKVIN
mgnify:CR=1 FL=1